MKEHPHKLLTLTAATSALPFDEALAAAREGMVTRETASVLIHADDGQELDLLMKAASELRERVYGRLVSFSKKVFIPLTNLCRDYCGYCTFRKDPGQSGAHTMTPDEVLAVAEAGARLGCKEALFSLGDRPEALFPEMRYTLRRFGHTTTLSYLTEMCERVLRETSLLPHANPGLMGRRDQERLRQFCPSIGLMLESSSNRLNQEGMPHENAPDKLPHLRLKTIEEAGRLGIPFTTGILIGIGETLDERVASLFVIRELNDKYGHIQEVIIQNFRAKPDIPMRDYPEPSLADLARTIAVARLVLSRVNIQAPPNLSDENYPFLLRAGLNDWGGISPLTRDYINPEKPWPHIESLRTQTAVAGYQLKERLCIYPEVVLRDEFASEEIARRIGSLADDDGYAKESRISVT
jgi:7,8-didemethyl-8-hydroxy-5-deazariboflavin synthase CofG subunit